MANCKKCGAALPSATFGELSDYCSVCRTSEVRPPRRRLIDEIPKLATTSLTWPLATVLLMAINIAVFAAVTASGISAFSPSSEGLLRWGANYGPVTLGGQYWRLITSEFLHGGFLHLAFNMVSLWILGRMVEKLFGPLITCGLYVATAAGASLLSLSWDPMRLSVGASGAIFGMAGVLISTLYYGKLGMEPEGRRWVLGWVVKIALLNLFYGLRGNVDNMAHLGGLVTGLLASIFLARTFSSPAPDRISHQARILAATALALALVVIPVRRAKVYAIELEQGESAVRGKDFTSAILHLQKYISLKPNDAYGHAMLGVALQNAKRTSDAVSEYQRSLALDPDAAWVEINLADIYFFQHKPAEAVALYKKSISPAEASALEYRLYGEALYDLQNYSDAEGVLRRSVAMDGKNPVAHELLADVYQKLGKTKESKQERQLASDLRKMAGE